MIEKRIKALRDFQLKTVFGFHFLSEGEVKIVKFKNERIFQSHLKHGNFVEAAPNEKESKYIPVILPGTEEEPFVVEPTSDIIGQEEEFVEECNGGVEDVRPGHERESERHIE